MKPTKRVNQAIAGVTALTLALSGCAGLTRGGRIGQDDGRDACRAHVVALDSTGNFFAEDMIKGAVIGAVGGALIGVAVSGGGPDAGRNAMIGALAGAAAGAGVGYWQHKMQQGQDQAILSVKNDLRQEIEQMDRSNKAFSQLIDCRQAQFTKIRNDFQAKLINRPQAESLWAAQRQYLDRDLKLAAMIDQDLGKRGQNFDFANQQINGPAPAVPEPEPAPAPVPERAKKSVKAKPTAPAKPKVEAKEPELSRLTATRQHKAGEFEKTIQTAKALDQSTQNPGFESGLRDPLRMLIRLG